MASIALEDVSKSFGRTDVLKKLRLSVAEGEFVVLLGPSGCGKSTLLRMIAGLETPTGGRILLDGADVTRTAAGDRDLAMVFQSYALYPHMDVAENMGLALKLRGMDKAAVKAKVTEAANMLSIGHLLSRKPRELSGGQRQRVAMGRAIVRSPRAFLFDEPLSNLDAELRLRMRAEIKRLHARLRTTTIYVTHDQLEALTLADRVVVLRGGELQQVGAPVEVFRRPANLFVAGFLGSPAMNVLRARVASTEGDMSLLAFEGVEGHCAIPKASFDTPHGVSLVVGLRPEEIRVRRAEGAHAATHDPRDTTCGNAGNGAHGASGAHGANGAHGAERGSKAPAVSIPGTISLIEPLGTEMLAHVEPRGAGRQATLVHRCVLREDLRPGDSVVVEAGAEVLHVFHGETERSLRRA